MIGREVLNNWRGKRSLFLAGAISLSLHGVMVAISHASQPSVVVFLSISAPLLLLYGWIVRAALRGKLSSEDVYTILIFSVLFRAVVVCGTPLFEDDMHRYLWDAQVWASGTNPYLHPPGSVILEDLRDDNWSSIGYSWIPTVYPPLAQLLFRAGHTFAPGSMLAVKSLVVCCDLALLGVLLLLLRWLRRPREWIVIYAWNPLVIKEFANSGHIDALALLCVSVFAYAFARRWHALAAVGLGLAIVAKLFPIVLWPLTLRHFRLRDHAVACLVVVGCYWPFLDAGELLFAGLGTYLTHWEFNDSAFVLLHHLFMPVGDFAFQLAKTFVAGAVLAVGLWWATRLKHQPKQVATAILACFGTLIVLGPTVNPWYICWIAPFLCITPRLPWIVLTTTACLSYTYWIAERDLWWVRVLEYAPFYALLLWELRPSRHTDPQLEVAAS